MKNNRKNKLFRSLLTITLMLPFFTNFTTVEAVGDKRNDIYNEEYEAGVTLKPVSPAFRYQTLLDWTPEKDPDSNLNRSTIPLNKNRFQGQQINNLANPDAKVTSAAIMNGDHDTTISVGGSNYNIYAFDNWQYIDSLIYWSGGTQEGIFAFPSPNITDVAHKNGVPVYATLGFPWGSGQYASVQELLNMLKRDEKGNFPFADKMIEIAVHFGFDGYFFNQETSGHNEETAKELNEFLRYFRAESRRQGTPLNISWYDAMSNFGGVNHRDSVDETNDLWMKTFENKDDYAADEFFMNYNWSKYKIGKTYDHMTSVGRNPYDAYAGFEVQQNSYNTTIRRNDLVGDDNKIRTSIALFAPNSTLGLSKNGLDFHKREQYFYTGPQGDPSLADDSEKWSGMSRFVTDKSVIVGTEFATHFNDGRGKKWYDNGNVVRNNEWNNRAVQSIMPTWRWWIKDLAGTRADISYDHDTVYNGGNSISISGKLESGTVNNIMLYSTKLDVTATTKAKLTYKSNDLAKISLGIGFEANYKDNEQVFYELPNTNNEWKTAVVDLSEYNSEIIHSLSVKIETEEDVDAKINLGALKITTDETVKLPSPENIQVKEALYHSTRSAEFRASWDKVEGAEYYEVYQVNNDEKRVLIGVTPNTHFYGEKITRTDSNAYGDNTTTIVVRPIDSNLNSGNVAHTLFVWPTNIDFSEIDDAEAPINVALNAQITSVSRENSAEPASAALDGISGSKWAASNHGRGHLDIKLSEEKTIKRWRVEHAEYGGENNDMNTVDFELQYKDANGEWKLAKHIKNNTRALTDVLLDEPITAQEWKLKVNNAGTSPWQAIRIYEWQLFESDVFPRPKNISANQVSATHDKDEEYINLTFKSVPENTDIHLYSSIDAEKPLMTINGKELEKNDPIGVGVNLQTKVKLADFINETGSMGQIFYSVQPDFSPESARNSVSIKIEAPKQPTYLHIKTTTGEGLNATYNLVHEDGTVIESGGSSDSGEIIELPIGKYSLRIKNVPRGYDFERAYNFNVVEQEENVEFIVQLQRTPGYDELGKLIYESSQISLDNYTVETSNALVEAIAIAEKIHKSHNASSFDYFNALANINKAIENLEEVVDISGLELLLTTAQGKDQNIYTAESILKLNEAIFQAQELLKDDSITKEKVEEAKNVLQKALDSLTVKENKIDKSQLEEILSVVKDIKKGNYSKDSYDNLQKLIEQAEALLGSENISQPELDKLSDELERAKDSLSLIVLDTAELEKSIEKAKMIDINKYTTQSIDVLLKSIGEAETLINRIINEAEMGYVEEPVTVNNIVEAEKALTKSIQELVLKDEAIDPVEPVEPEEPTSPSGPNTGNTGTDKPAAPEDQNISNGNQSNGNSTDNANDSDNGKNPELSDSKDTIEKLPSTGMKSMMSIVIPSGLLVGLGYAIIRLNRKKTVE